MTVLKIDNGVIFYTQTQSKNKWYLLKKCTEYCFENWLKCLEFKSECESELKIYLVKIG